VDGLDEIAAGHDLTLVATGKGGLSSLFARHESRSVFNGPQRSLLMLTVTGLGFDEAAFAHRSPAGGTHAAFSFVGDEGETWWGPYYHKDAGPSWSFLGWAKSGSQWEQRFSAAASAQTALEIVTDLHRDFIPWDLPEVLQPEVISQDPHSWLKGAVAPEVREGLGRTKSGRVVASLGDAAIAYDPLAGQGAQSGLIQTAIYVNRIVGHGGPFDEHWIREAYETFYAQRGAGGELVTRLFLGHPELGSDRRRRKPGAAAYWQTLARPSGSPGHDERKREDPVSRDIEESRHSCRFGRTRPQQAHPEDKTAESSDDRAVPPSPLTGSTQRTHGEPREQ